MIAYVTRNEYGHHVAAGFYCNFYLVAVYHPPVILNVSRSLNNPKDTIVNVEKDLCLDVKCSWVQLEKRLFPICLIVGSYNCL